MRRVKKCLHHHWRRACIELKADKSAQMTEKQLKGKSKAKS